VSRRNGVTVRGTSNGNDSGNSRDRRRRRAWLLSAHRDPETGQVPCLAELHHPDCPGFVDEHTLTVGRIRAGVDGGTYRRDNIRPEFGLCNSRHGGGLRRRS
jgi:hypothetical protein